MKKRMIGVLVGISILACGCRKNESQSQDEVSLSIIKTECVSEAEQKLPETPEEYLEDVKKERAWGEHVNLPPDLSASIFNSDFRVTYTGLNSMRSASWYSTPDELLNGSGKIFGSSTATNEEGEDIMHRFTLKETADIRIYLALYCYGSNKSTEFSLMRDDAELWTSGKINESADFYLDLDHAVPGTYWLQWTWDGYDENKTEEENWEGAPVLNMDAFIPKKPENFSEGIKVS